MFDAFPTSASGGLHSNSTWPCIQHSEKERILDQQICHTSTDEAWKDQSCNLQTKGKKKKKKKLWEKLVSFCSSLTHLQIETEDASIERRDSKRHFLLPLLWRSEPQSELKCPRPEQPSFRTKSFAVFPSNNQTWAKKNNKKQKTKKKKRKKTKKQQRKLPC